MRPRPRPGQGDDLVERGLAMTTDLSAALGLRARGLGQAKGSSLPEPSFGM